MNKNTGDRIAGTWHKFESIPLSSQTSSADILEYPSVGRAQEIVGYLRHSYYFYFLIASQGKFV